MPPFLSRVLLISSSSSSSHGNRAIFLSLPIRLCYIFGGGGQEMEDPIRESFPPLPPPPPPPPSTYCTWACVCPPWSRRAPMSARVLSAGGAI